MCPFQLGTSVGAGDGGVNELSDVPASYGWFHHDRGRVGDGDGGDLGGNLEEGGCGDGGGYMPAANCKPAFDSRPICLYSSLQSVENIHD